MVSNFRVVDGIPRQLNTQTWQAQRMIQFGTTASVVYFFLLYFAVNLSLVFSARSLKTLYIGGLFPMTGPSAAYAGEELLRVSKLAINMVNSRSDVLPDYRLQLVWNDTKVFKINCILVTL